MSATELSGDREAVRNVAKWYVAALGAIGAIVLAGTQLSSIGALPLNAPRLWLAAASVIIGFGAILVSISAVVTFLAGVTWTFEDVRREAAKPGDVQTWIKNNPTSLGSYSSVTKLQKAYDDAESDDDETDLLQVMNELTDATALVSTFSQLAVMRRIVTVTICIAAIGILAFTWAANPGATPPASLRAANLKGSDLGGASLRNADLTRANLTGANLRGADMRGANVKDVVWGNTVCPDGSNSDSQARPAASGRLTGATCEGHLQP